MSSSATLSPSSPESAIVHPVSINGNYKISYPLDPKKSPNPLKDFKSNNFQPKYSEFSSINNFYSEYKIDSIQNSDNYNNENTEIKTFQIQSKAQNRFELVKVYNVNKLEECYKHILFIRETILMEYYETYYDPKHKRIFIRQPIYSQTLYSQINNKKLQFDTEKSIKYIIGDILDKLWNIHNCGFVYGNIHPNNIVKREFNDNNEFIKDGWKLINFENIQKYKKENTKYIGNVGWSAPEINAFATKSNKNKYLYSSDIFSLGLLILFILFGEQPLQITDKELIKYGQNCDLFDNNNNNEKIKQFKQDLKMKMYKKWYNKLLKSENIIKNYLIKLYYHNKISLNLFELLYVGMLNYNPQKRWNCQQIYNCKWFEDIRRIDNKKKVQKLRILLHV